MGNSSSVADYITRGQLLPGPVLRTVTHSRDVKSLADKKTTQTEKALFCFFFPCIQQREIPGKPSEYKMCVSFCFCLVCVLFAALQVYLSKQLLLKSHALSVAARQRASADSSLNSDRLKWKWLFKEKHI